MLGKTALITGGAKRLGRASALALARAGADVAVPYLSRSAEADSVARDIRDLGRRAMVFGGDLADPTTCDRMAEAVRQAGIAPLDVIRWATKNGAEMARAGDRLGTVTEGKLVRDLIPNLIRESGRHVEVRHLRAV